MSFFKKIFKKKDKVRKRKDNPDVYDFPDENQRMNWAIEKAHLTFHYFQDCLNNPKENQQYFSVKARIEDENGVEHIWLNDPGIDEKGVIYGTVGNEPIDVKTVQIGDKIKITSKFLSDWMIIENGRLIGGYTIRAIRNGIKSENLAEFDQSLGGIYVDEGEDYFLANFDTPEGAILMMEQAYSDENLENALLCKNFDKEAEFMLNKTVNFEIDQDLINQTSEVLRLAFIKEIKENGFPKFDGVKRAFKRQVISSNHCIITEICVFPDGSKTIDKLNMYLTNKEWKMIGPVDYSETK